jgi:adenylate cyclase
MGADEVGTLRELTQRRATLDSLIASHRGRIANTAGDSVLAEFGSAVDAVQCAVHAQAALAGANMGLSPDLQINFRIGIHVGDVMIKGGDLFGDGVNIAARLEGIAKPGGICMSDDAYRQVRGKVETGFDDMGVQSLKNIAEPMRAWRIQATSENSAAASQPQPLALPDKPSIAVLPFQNMSGDPEQEYFADGVVEDITTALSRFKSLFVIARNSSFTYKGKAVDVKQVGRELGVRYVLEGSIRRLAGKVRITGQLIEAVTAAHLWADKFDGELSDIFSLQDEIAEKVAALIEPNIKRAEIEAAQRRPYDLNAYDTYLRALPRYYSLTEDGLADALRLCYRALDIDPRYTAAARLAAEVLGIKVAQGWSTDVKADYAESFRLGRLFLEIDGTDPDSLAQWGRGVAAFSNDYEAAKDAVDRAVALNPNSARAWAHRGWTYRYMKMAEEALTSFERAIRLNPLDPLLFDALTGVASTLIIVGRDEEAVLRARRAIGLNPRFTSAHRCLVAALAYLGRDAEAKQAAAALMDIEPSFSIRKWANYGGQWQGQRFLDGLRLAGLPE